MQLFSQLPLLLQLLSLQIKVRVLVPSPIFLRVQIEVGGVLPIQPPLAIALAVDVHVVEGHQVVAAQFDVDPALVAKEIIWPLLAVDFIPDG